MLLATVVSCVVVLLFDTVAASISKATRIAYKWFSIPGFILYMLMGFVLIRTLNSGPLAFIAIAIAAITEATLGWMISVGIGPGRPPNFAPSTILFAILLAFFTNGIFGMLGVWIYGLVRQNG